MDRWATFDCYGTLIDWNAGIRAALAGIWPDDDPEALLASYHEAEPRLEEDGTRSYREVLTRAVVEIGASRELAVPDGASAVLADSVAWWQPFPEVAGSLGRLREAGWRLAILSNTDADYLDASLSSIGVPVDELVVASDIGSYKPAFAHWETFFRRTGADRGRHVHVAASLFHDVEPAAALGLPCVWINRLGESSQIPRAGELPDLSALPATLERLVPAG
ncbi:MAG: HAD-IA family hydrolase [Actinomycetota bacterium]|nr:HAD-IA family hydrolase [Actinomycetota bacterium]